MEHLLFCKQVVHVLLGTSAAQRHFVIGMRQFFADLARVKRDTGFSGLEKAWLQELGTRIAESQGASLVDNV